MCAVSLKYTLRQESTKEILITRSSWIKTTNGSNNITGEKPKPENTTKTPKTNNSSKKEINNVQNNKNILIKTGTQLFDKKNEVKAQPEGYNLYYFNYSHFFSGQLAFNVNKEKKKIELYYIILDVKIDNRV